MNTVRERKGGVVSRHAKNPLGIVTLWWQKKKNSSGIVAHIPKRVHRWYPSAKSRQTVFRLKFAITYVIYTCSTRKLFMEYSVRFTSVRFCRLGPTFGAHRTTV